MAQYYIVEERNLSKLPWAGTARRMGFLDFLRALQNDPPALPHDDAVRVDGIEETLIASRPKMEEMCREFHRLLQQAAPKLERLNSQIAIVVRAKIVHGAQLTVEHPTVGIPFFLIFGSPTGEESYYPVGFNLSSG